MKLVRGGCYLSANKLLGRGEKSSFSSVHRVKSNICTDLLIETVYLNNVSVYILHMCHFSLCGRTQNFCSGIVAHIVVGNLYKNVRQFYLKFLGGGFNQTLSISGQKDMLNVTNVIFYSDQNLQIRPGVDSVMIGALDFQMEGQLFESPLQNSPS